MRFDDQTARDLEIFRGQPGQPSLFELLDRTRTTGGREALRRRFQRPLAAPARIAAVQASLRFVSAQRRAFEALPKETELKGLERYLASNVVTSTATRGPGAAVEALWALVAYRDVVRAARRGVELTRRVLDWVASFAAAPALGDAPGELRDHLGELRALLDSDEIARVRRARGGVAAWLYVLRDDRAIREDARQPLLRLLGRLHEIDALVSMADATVERGFVFPEILETPGEIHAEGAYHPFLPAPVPNDLRLDEARRLLFLTGPNMAGKTTHLRACGLAVYLAHLGMGVPARRLRLSVFDALLTAIGLSDNVREGISFFRAEALRMKLVAQALAAGDHVFGIFDEPFKGTNVRDALDASRAVLLRLARAQGSAFLVASHLIELADALEPLPAVLAERFEADEAGGELRYDYLARPGVSTQRLGMRVLEEEGVFELFDRGLAVGNGG